MLVHVGWFLVQAFFEPLYESQEILGHVLLLSNLVCVAKVINYSIQNRRWIHVLLICKHQFDHQFLHVCCHLCACILPLQDLQLVLFFLLFFLVLGCNTLNVFDLHLVLLVGYLGVDQF